MRQQREVNEKRTPGCYLLSQSEERNSNFPYRSHSIVFVFVSLTE